MKSLRTKLTYANVISTLCLFFVLGGGAAFAATQLPKNSVGTKQLKPNAVTTAKIKDGAISSSKIDLSSLGTVPSANHADVATKADSAASAGTASSATDAKALGGKPASAFAASSVIRSATVLNGNVVASRSDGITQSNIGPHTPGSGEYCIDGLNPPPTTMVASVGFGSTIGTDIYLEVPPPGEPGCQAYVAMYNAAGNPVDAPFTVLIH
jgi:hypothetical protein